MEVQDVPPLSLGIIERNHSDYSSLSDSEILEHFNCVYDITKAPVLTDEDKAETLLKETIADNGFILIIGDYDSDGLNGSAVAYKALKDKSDNYRVIHNKRIHHNGFNPTLVAKIKRIHDRKPIDLIITIDHGSSSKDAFVELKEYGVKHILVTDHHEIADPTIEDIVDVFINPQKASGDPVGMCGTYVVFKILSCLYVDDRDIYENFYKPCLPHVAMATVSDVMSLNIPYNRLVVRAGLQIINNDHSGLWNLLKKKLNIPVKYCYKDFGFILSPFINTGNRVNEEELFYRILIEEDLDRLNMLIDKGVKFNIKRKEVKKAIMRDLAYTIDSNSINKSLALIVDTSMAINGIIASSLGEQYQVPTTCFLLDKENQTLSGSSRGIVDHISIVSLYREMAKIDNTLFNAYGGHKGAGGCSIAFDKFERFKELFEVTASKVTVPDIIEKVDNVIDIHTKYLSYGIVEEVDYAGPFGKDWAMPSFRGLFKIKSIFAMKSLVIMTLLTLGNKEIKGTYFYNRDDSQDSIEYQLQRGLVIRAVFEPQYYKRYNRVNFTLMINSFTEA